MEIIRKLNSCGKAFYVKYFEKVLSSKIDDNLINEINAKENIKTAKYRLNIIKNSIENDYYKQMLEIILKSKRIDENYKIKAKKILCK